MTNADLPNRPTPSQQAAFVHLRRAFASGTGRLVFAAGASGTGRSRLVENVVGHGLGGTRAVVTDPDEPGLLGPLLALADEPLVLALDDADELPAQWWLEVLAPASQNLVDARAIALLVISDDPPRHVRTIVDRLVAQDLADELPLQHVSRADLTTWLGPMSPIISSALWDLTGGQVADVHELMSGWIRDGSIARGTGGQWTQQRLFDRTPADFTRLLVERLRAQLGPDIAPATRLLASAAMQGPTFLVEASIRAVGLDDDTAVDLLDGPLSTIVEELPSVRVGDEVRWRYRFVRRLDRRIAAERLLADRERREIADRTAAAVAELYAPAARASSSDRSRSLEVSEAARSNSERASS